MRSEQAEQLLRRGRDAGQAGRLEEATRCFREAASHAESGGDWPALASSLILLGRATDAGVVAEAEQATGWLPRVEGLLLRRSDGIEWAEPLELLGAHLAQIGEIDRAAQCLLEAIAVRELGSDKLHLAYALGMAVPLFLQLRRSDTTEFAQRSVELEREVGTRMTLTVSLVLLGDALSVIGRNDDARSAWEEALFLRRERVGSNVPQDRMVADILRRIHRQEPER